MQTRSTGQTPVKRGAEAEDVRDTGTNGAFEARNLIARLNHQEPHKVLAIAKHSGFIFAKSAAIAALHEDGFSLDLGPTLSARKVKWEGVGKLTSEEGCRRMDKLASDACHVYFTIGLLEFWIIAMLVVVLPAISLLPLDVTLYMLAPVRTVGLFIFGSQTGLQWVLRLAWLAHLIEGTAAGVLAVRMGFSPRQTLGWFLGVSLIGFPCLQHIIALHKSFSSRKVK